MSPRELSPPKFKFIPPATTPYSRQPPPCNIDSWRRGLVEKPSSCGRGIQTDFHLLQEKSSSSGREVQTDFYHLPGTMRDRQCSIRGWYYNAEPWTLTTIPNLTAVQRPFSFFPHHGAHIRMNPLRWRRMCEWVKMATF
jgi:hypothetical protein